MSPLRRKQTPKKKKNLDRIRKLISRAEKRGYIFPDELKSQLPNFSTQKLKSLTAEKLYAQAIAVDMETGEILSGTEARRKERSISAKLGALTRKARQAASGIVEGIKSRLAGAPEVAIPTGPESVPPPEPWPKPLPPPEPEPTPPPGWQIIMDFLNDFLKFLDEPRSPYGISRRGRTYKRVRLWKVAQVAEDQAGYLRKLVADAIARDGEAAVAWRLYDNGEEVGACIDAFRYSSDASVIMSAASALAAIINGGPLTMQQALAIGEQSEYNESWEEPE